MLRRIKSGENIGVAIQIQGHVVDAHKHAKYKGLYSFTFCGVTWVCSDFAFDNENKFKCRKCGEMTSQGELNPQTKEVLCGKCYCDVVYGSCNCEHCHNSYFEDGDKLRCSLSKCNPVYDN